MGIWPCGWGGGTGAAAHGFQARVWVMHLMAPCTSEEAKAARIPLPTHRPRCAPQRQPTPGQGQDGGNTAPKSGMSHAASPGVKFAPCRSSTWRTLCPGLHSRARKSRPWRWWRRRQRVGARRRRLCAVRWLLGGVGVDGLLASFLACLLFAFWLPWWVAGLRVGCCGWTG